MTLFLGPQYLSQQELKQWFYRLGMRHAEITKKFSVRVFQIPAADVACEPVRQMGAMIAFKYVAIDHEAIFLAANIGFELVASDLDLQEVPNIQNHLIAYERAIDALNGGIGLLESKATELSECLGENIPVKS